MASAEAAYWRKKLPQRFTFLLEKLGRAIIEEQPENIFLFSAEFIEKLIGAMNEELNALPQYNYLQQLLKRKKLESFLVTGASRLDYKTGDSSMDVNKAAAETHKGSTGKDGEVAVETHKGSTGNDGEVAVETQKGSTGNDGEVAVETQKGSTGNDGEVAVETQKGSTGNDGEVAVETQKGSTGNDGEAAVETHKDSTGKDGEAAADASKMVLHAGTEGQVASPVNIVLEVTAPDKQADEPESDKGSSDVIETQHPSKTVIVEPQKVPSMAAIKVDESIQRKQSHHEFKHKSLLDCQTKEDIEMFLAMNPNFCPEYQLSALAFPTVDLLIQLQNTQSQQARLELLQQMQKKQAEEQREALPEFCPEYQASSLLFSTTALEAMDISHLDEPGYNEQKQNEQEKEVSQKPELQLSDIASPVAVHKPSEQRAGFVEIVKNDATMKQVEPKRSFTEPDSHLTTETPKLEKSAHEISAQPSAIEKTPSQQLPETEMVQISGESDAKQSSEGNAPTEISTESVQKAIEPTGPDQQNAAENPQDEIEAAPVPINNEEVKEIQPDATQNNNASLNIEDAPASEDDIDVNLKMIQGKELMLSNDQTIADSANIETGPKQNIETNGTSFQHDVVAVTNV